MGFYSLVGCGVGASNISVRYLKKKRKLWGANKFPSHLLPFYFSFSHFQRGMYLTLPLIPYHVACSSAS